MSLHFFNSLTRHKDEFKPIYAGEVRVYSCGPTVYWFAHIGTMRAFLFSDFLHRVLRFNGLWVKLVMNVTDVGHLVSDADEGDDKMLVAMRREGKTAYEIAEFYAQEFFHDLERLNILPATAYPRATEHVPEQIAMVEELEKKGFVYRTSDGVYFDTSKLPKYGRLSGQNADEKLAGVRVEMGEKRHATDFALWKFASEGVKREMIWPSPWGDGFPGWHLECSAMSVKYLEAPFDIHTGGVDHIAVHHENELAQTQGALGVLQANVWMHSEFLTVDGGKMSKSLGNFYTIQNLTDRGYDPLAYRYFVLGAHYRSKLNFTWEALDGAQSALRNLYNFCRSLPESADNVQHPDALRVLEDFQRVLNDDLNTAQALAILWDAVRCDFPSQEKSAMLLRMDNVLGLRLNEYVGKSLEVPADIQRLVEKREAVRQEKNWKESDRLREEIEEAGYLLEDTSHGPVVRKK